MATVSPNVAWVDADTQPSFLRGMGLGGPEDAPTCLLLQHRPKPRVARMAASFSADAVALLLTRGNFQPLQVRTRMASEAHTEYWMLHALPERRMAASFSKDAVALLLLRGNLRLLQVCQAERDA